MKKRYLLPTINILALSTAILLVIIFVRYYEPTPKPVESNPQENQVVDDDVQDNNIEDNNMEENNEPLSESEKKPLEFVQSEKTYFDDAIIIGDSRTVGIFEYGDMGGITFFASEGMSIYDIWEESVSIKGKGSTSLESVLKSFDYKKIYIMLGINELGYEQTKTVEKYKETLDKLHEMRPDAIIYICSNLHVTATQSESNEIFNNRNIDKFNEQIKAFADGETFFYLDVNQKFNDGAGNLGTEYTSDNVHILAKYYVEWADWFSQNTIVKE